MAPKVGQQADEFEIYQDGEGRYFLLTEVFKEIPDVDKRKNTPVEKLARKTRRLFSEYRLPVFSGTFSAGRKHCDAIARLEDFVSSLDNGTHLTRESLLGDLAIYDIKLEEWSTISK